MWIRTARRIAWRDLRSSPGQWAFTVATIALSFASLSGVRSAAITVADALSHGSRQWIAADICVNLDNWPDPDQRAELDQLRASGIEWTIVTSAMSTAASESAADSTFAIVKAVDPAEYPYYGAVVLDGGQSLRGVLTPETTVVSEDVVSRLAVRSGDQIRIGAASYKIAGVMRSEPDRFVGVPGAGVRIILSRDGYVRSGIARGGSFEYHRALLRLPAGADVDGVLRRLEGWFPGANMTDYRDANPQIVWAIGTALTLLNLPPFLALAVGAFGIAIAVRAHVEQRLDMAAVLKMLGGRSAQINAVFGFQIFAMVAIGVAIGIPLGWIAKTSVVAFGSRFGPLSSQGFSVRELAEGLAAACIAILPALVRPVMLIRDLRPAIIMRRNTEERTAEGVSAPKSFRIAVIGIVCFVLIGGMMLRSWDSVAFLLAGLAGNAAVVWIFATLCLRLMRGMVSSRALPGPVRYGLGNLYRPANRSRTLIVAVGLGLSTIVGTFETHQSVARAIVKALPFDHANLLVAAVDDAQSRSLPAVLRSIPGAEGAPETLNLAWMRLAKIDGVEPGKMVPRQWLASCENDSQQGLSISSTTAKLTGAKIGSSVEFYGKAAQLEFKVSAIRSVDPMQEIWHSFTFDCGALDRASLFHDAAIRVRPDLLASATRDLRARYPALAVISAEDLASTVSELTRQTEELVRLLAWYTLAAGVSVLIALVVASRAARRDEIATLTALGATRGWIARAYLSEYAAVGFLAGLVGGVLTSGFETLLLSVIFRTPTIVFQPEVAAASAVASAILAAGAAWVPVHPLLKHTPIEMLRRLKGN